jgi:hypothetical protein
MVSPYQYRKVAVSPDMIWQLVQRIKKKYEGENIEIYAISRVSLNGHDFQPLIKPDYDMAQAKWHYFRSEEWINPYSEEDLVKK